MSDKSDYRSQLAEFREQLRGVKPIEQTRAPDASPRPALAATTLAYRRNAAEEGEELVVDGLSSISTQLLGAEEEILFSLPGVQLRLLKRMQAGHLGWEAGLDLHGYSIDQAREELYTFIRDARSRGLRSVLIVHGKAYTDPGKPALIKSYVNDWLQQTDGVLAFCSAQPQDGGTGALYVLLKRDRDTQRR